MQYISTLIQYRESDHDLERLSKCLGQKHGIHFDLLSDPVEHICRKDNHVMMQKCSILDSLHTDVHMHGCELCYKLCVGKLCCHQFHL
jgi:hypothetical protein